MMMQPECAASSSAGRQQQQRRVQQGGATADGQCDPRKVFIGGLAHKTTTQHLREYFGEYGLIVDAVVLRWPDGRSRGFGYVTFSDVSAVSPVLEATHNLAGRQLDVKRAVPGTNKLFVGGLPQNVVNTELREYFQRYGTVSDAVVMIDPATQRSRGFGFICFLPGQEGAAAVASALEQYKNHRIRGKWVEVKSAAPPRKLLAGKDDAASAPFDVQAAWAGAAYPAATPALLQSVAAPPPLPGAPPAAPPAGAPAGAVVSQPPGLELPLGPTLLAPLNGSRKSGGAVDPKKLLGAAALAACESWRSGNGKPTVVGNRPIATPARSGHQQPHHTAPEVQVPKLITPPGTFGATCPAASVEEEVQSTSNTALDAPPGLRITPRAKPLKPTAEELADWVGPAKKWRSPPGIFTNLPPKTSGSSVSSEGLQKCLQELFRNLAAEERSKAAVGLSSESSESS